MEVRAIPEMQVDDIDTNAPWCCLKVCGTTCPTPGPLSTHHSSRQRTLPGFRIPSGSAEEHGIALQPAACNAMHRRNWLDLAKPDTIGLRDVSSMSTACPVRHMDRHVTEALCD